MSQFTITDQTEITFQAGMTAITGETGAGKSITIDALGLALGGRADSSLIKQGYDKANIHAIFNIDNIPTAKKWLQNQDLDSDDECILRRIINKDGPSKAMINGVPVNVRQLQELGQLLINIHSQHAHQRLLQREYHQQLLDNYAGCTALSGSTMCVSSGI